VSIVPLPIPKHELGVPECLLLVGGGLVDVRMRYILLRLKGQILALLLLL